MTAKGVLKKFVAYAASKAGVLVIPEWRLDSYFLATRVRRIFAEYKITCVFDVGANVGQYREFLRDSVEYRGLIVSFEPDPKKVAVLKKKKKFGRELGDRADGDRKDVWSCEIEYHDEQRLQFNSGAY